MLVFGLLCFGVFSLLVEGQNVGNRPRALASGGRPRPQQMAEDSNAGSPRRRPMSGRNSQDEPFLPQSWRDLIQRNGGVHDVNDFINLLVTPEGRQVTEDDSGIMATSDECSPRNMSVRLPLNYSDNQLAYYPECTMVQRCGGCTPTQFLSCEPLYKEKIVLKVLRGPLSVSGGTEHALGGVLQRGGRKAPVLPGRVQPAGEGLQRVQRFNRYQCKCICTRSQRCFNEKVWDPELCRCRCPNEGPCCAEEGEEDDRTCTSYFDHDFCECTLKTSIGLGVNASQEEIDRYLAIRRANRTTSTTTTTTAAPTNTASTTTTTISTTTSAPSTTPLCNPCPRRFRLRITNAAVAACLSEEDVDVLIVVVAEVPVERVRSLSGGVGGGGRTLVSG